MKENKSPLITVIGRGHSGTRAISHTLSASGVFMGAKLNVSGDLIPAEEMYEACRVMSRHVVHKGGYEWDFSRLHTMPIDPAFTRLVESYLSSVLSSGEKLRGWKVPETTLVFPWIVRMFPDNAYIFWIRDPRDSILGRHITDDLNAFGVPWDKVEDIYLSRAASWKYQCEIVKATPPPKHITTVRFEDFVLDHRRALDRLENHLGFPLAEIEVRAESIARWKQTQAPLDWDIFRDELIEFGYE